MFRNYLTWISILVIVFGASFFIVGNFIKKPINEKSSDLVKIPIENENNITLNNSNKAPTLEPEKNPVVIKNKEATKLPVPPELGRPINITTSISGLEKDEVIEEIKHFEASLANKPENTNEWIQLGNLRKIIGDYLGAEQYWKYASVLMPTYHVPYNNLGNLYQYYLNDVVKAEEDYKKYIELSPQTEEPYKLLFDLYTTSYKEKENLAEGVLEEGIKNATYNDYLRTLLEIYRKEKSNNI